jgi:hypothetical protein
MMTMIDRHGGMRSVERFFMERDSSWRDSLRGQTSPRRECLHGDILSVEGLLRGEKSSAERFSKERLSPWREQPRREILHGETLSVEKPLQGEMISKERISLWRDSSRREELRGEPDQLQLAKLRRLVHISFTSLCYSFGWFTSSSSFVMHFCNLASLLFYAFQGFD